MAVQLKHPSPIWLKHKNSFAEGEEKMQKYKIQIDAYAKVCERVFGKIVTKKAIYFIDEQKNIEFWFFCVFY